MNRSGDKCWGSPHSRRLTVASWVSLSRRYNLHGHADLAPEATDKDWRPLDHGGGGKLEIGKMDLALSITILNVGLILLIALWPSVFCIVRENRIKLDVLFEGSEAVCHVGLCDF